MTKKQLTKWLKEEGYTTSYSGKTKTMFVHGIDAQKLKYFNLSTKGITVVAD